MPDDATREPGAPIGKDEIDPDLVRLRRGAPQIGLIAAAGVVLLCLALIVRLRHDFAYAREADTARAVTVDAIVAGQVAANSYVTLVAPPDRVGAIRLRGSKSNSGTRMAAARGTGDRLWLALPGDSFDRRYQHDDRVTGRLRKLADVRYAGPLARALAKYPAPRFVTGAELRRAKLAAATQVTLIDGATLPVAGTDELDLAIADPGAAVVVAALGPGRAVDGWDCGPTAPSINLPASTGGDLNATMEAWSFAFDGNVIEASPGEQVLFGDSVTMRDSNDTCPGCNDQVEVGWAGGVDRARAVGGGDPRVGIGLAGAQRAGIERAPGHHQEARTDGTTQHGRIVVAASAMSQRATAGRSKNSRRTARTSAHTASSPIRIRPA